jgi:hypothetical protein
VLHAVDSSAHGVSVQPNPQSSPRSGGTEGAPPVPPEAAPADPLAPAAPAVPELEPPVGAEPPVGELPVADEPPEPDDAPLLPPMTAFLSAPPVSSELQAKAPRPSAEDNKKDRSRTFAD